MTEYMFGNETKNLLYEYFESEEFRNKHPRLYKRYQEDKEKRLKGELMTLDQYAYLRKQQSEVRE